MVNQQTPQRLFLLRGLFYKVLNKKPSARGMSRNREGGPFNDICSRSGGIEYIDTGTLNFNKKPPTENGGGNRRGF